MRAIVAAVLSVLLSVLLHLTLGWGWTLLAGAAVGYWRPRGAAWAGAVGVGIGWALLVGYNFAVDAGAMGRMLAVVGGLLGNLPGVLVVGITLVAGVLLGLLGGLLGAQLRHLAGPRSSSRVSA